MKQNNTFSSISKTLSVKEKNCDTCYRIKKIFYKFLAIIDDHVYQEFFFILYFFSEHQISILIRDNVHTLAVSDFILFLISGRQLYGIFLMAQQRSRQR